jgi:hypothetical protein
VVPVTELTTHLFAEDGFDPMYRGARVWRRPSRNGCARCRNARYRRFGVQGVDESAIDVETATRACSQERRFVVGGYGRLCLVKDGAPGLCGPYAAVEIGHLSAKYSKSALGSGPRGRWFESTRPDQFLKNPRKSAEFSLAVHSVLSAQIGSREPSARYFKRWPSEKLFDTRS